MENLIRTSHVQKSGEDLEKWHIAYTFPKAERKAFKKLEMLGITSFLPLHQEIRNWSDRKKKLEVPVFPNYIFIYTNARERYGILQMKELVRYITLDGKPVIIPETLISTLKKMLKGDVEVSHEAYYEGMPIKVTDGLFCGAEGILVRKNSQSRLVIQIEALRRTVSVDISASSVMQLHDLKDNVKVPL